MTFAEATKISRVWLKGRQSHCIQLHIEVLKKQTMLFKNHNKAGSEMRVVTQGKERMLALLALILRL
ncbi:hypothetical protein PCORN_15331 [Listeria cornellensis FSL F6-0969]|uniref:Uncharacterized protein n=1 Tax=Listeria cornellensis FSL F6-0969 TaxID=1265820 RepID=W7C0F6_9LIST|nr:hypothetical protein PCORN_15331 [Listeria cornellensis FSL F6-0969]